MGITISLQIYPLFVKIDLDLRNAYMFISSRDKTEKELESDFVFHYPLEVFKALNGKSITL